MKIDVRFAEIELIAAKFRSTRSFSLDTVAEGWQQIASQLRKGIEISIDDLDIDDGLLVYKGHHVILYIRDHGYRVGAAILDASKGNRFHVAECETLEKMRMQGRFDRYVVTQNISGLFEIAGTDPTTKNEQKGTVALQVCMHCLKRLNYRSSLVAPVEQRRSIRDNFSLVEFFETYSTRFSALPSDFSGMDNSAMYPTNWKELSQRIRIRAGFRCDECAVSLVDNQSLLHVHHVNGVKNDNREENLRPLCKDCHRKQPAHGHIFMKAEEMNILQRLRRQQGIVSSTWESALKHADTAMRPVLEVARYRGWPPPTLDHEVPMMGRTIHFDAAWPARKLGVSSTVIQTEAPDWEVVRPGKLLRDLSDAP